MKALQSCDFMQAGEDGAVDEKGELLPSFI